MPAETAFIIVNAAALPFWLLLVFLPHQPITHRLVHSGLFAVLFGVIYIFYLGIALTADAPAGAGMGSLAGLQAAFADPRALLAGWVHYLVFDLFVGAWITRDARRNALPHPAIVVPLVLTLLAGPFGLLLYLVLKGAWKHQFSLRETA